MSALIVFIIGVYAGWVTAARIIDRKAMRLLGDYIHDLDAALRWVGAEDDADLLAIQHDFYDEMREGRS